MSDRQDMIRRVARRESYRRRKKARRQQPERTKTAGEVRFVTDQASDRERQIPDDFQFDKNQLQDLSRVMWGLSCSLGHLVSSHNKFTKIKSVNVSPDGKLGGQGYVQKIKSMREDLSDCVEVMSEAIDTIHDEVEAPHWSEEWSDMSEEERQEAEEMIEDSEEIVGEPESFAEEELQEEIDSIDESDE